MILENLEFKYYKYYRYIMFANKIKIEDMNILYEFTHFELTNKRLKFILNDILEIVITNKKFHFSYVKDRKRYTLFVTNKDVLEQNCQKILFNLI